AICAILYSPIGLLYGQPNFNTITTFLATNNHEVLGFLITIPPYLFIPPIIIFFFFILILKTYRYTLINNKLYLLLLLLVVGDILHAPLKVWLNKQPLKLNYIKFIPIRFTYQTIYEYKQVK